MNLLQRTLALFLPKELRIILKANELSLQGRYDEVFRKYENHLGIEEVERFDIAAIRHRIGEWLSQNGRNDTTLMFAAQYAAAFGLVRKHRVSLTVLETALELNPEDFHDRKRLAAKLDIYWHDIQPVTQIQFLMGLNGVLSIVGRQSEAFDVFYYDLGILNLDRDEEEDMYKAEVVESIYLRLDGLPLDIIAAYLSFIFTAFEKIGIQKQGLEAFEKLIGLTQEDYSNSVALSQKLQQWIAKLTNPLSGQYALFGIASTLYTTGEEHKALAILEGYAGIIPADYEQVEVLGQKWQSLRAKLPVDTAASYLRMLIVLLEEVRRNPAVEVKALLLADCGLRDADFDSDEAISRKLNVRLDGLQKDTKAGFIYSLSNFLSEIGLVREASIITDWFIRQHREFWEIPSEGDPSITHIIALLTSWFQFYYQADKQTVLQYCQQTVTYLRYGFGSQGIRLEDREEFIRYVTLLKKAVLEAGFFWLHQDQNLSEEPSIASKVFLWDVELTQRLLAERFTLKELQIFPATNIVKPNHWACLEDMPDPDTYPVLQELAAMEPAGSAALGVKDSEMPEVELVEADAEKANFLSVAPQMYEILKRPIDTGITPAQIAASVGKHALILRMTLDGEGRLTWLAFFSDGNALRFVAQYHGHPDDSNTIWQLAKSHDKQINLFWEIPNQGKQFLTDLTRGFVEELSPLLRLDLLADYFDESKNVVLQVDNHLYSIPFAHVPVNGIPLFLQVRSITHSLSFVMNVLQQAAQANQAEQSRSHKKIGVASWFHREDFINRESARWLHAGHFSLANRHGISCFAAADSPPCSIASIAGLVQQHRNFKVLTLCGHGTSDKRGGIRLKDHQDLWRGNGCDLSGISLLLMVSCSIGKMTVDQYLDVEGFCIQLAVYRAFSVAACRWPVHSLEACLFANEIAGQYLLLSEEAEKKGEAENYLKARALNEAKKIFHKSTGDDALLSTMAAFEFYGID
ncbi:MAG: hypothetical protein IT260_00430 [Saprospiraceae bacterium]|nr:hypothetical protein [Saprospiraceae bacterium]